MKGPRCRLCGEHHWGACAFKPDPAEIREMVDTPQRALAPKPIEPPQPAEPTRRKPGRPRGAKPFDRDAYRRAYMRQYIRRRRAAQKGQPHDAQ
jgi:hypothetical protein